MKDEPPQEALDCWLAEQEPNIKPTQRDPRTGRYRYPRRGAFGGLAAPIGLAVIAVGLVIYAAGVIGPGGWLLR